MNPVKFIVITADGILHQGGGELDLREELGPEGHVRVRLHPESLSAAFVNDVGLRFPEKYPRNIVGSCVLASLGAPTQPYAGPIVITGWQSENTARGLNEMCSLRIDLEILVGVHDDVRRALAGEAVPEAPPGWAQDMCDYAEHLRTCPTPGLTVITMKARDE